MANAACRCGLTHSMRGTILKHKSESGMQCLGDSKFKEMALARELSWLEHHPDTPKLRVRSPVRALTRISQ